GVEGDEVEHLREGEREHGEVDAAPPEAEEPDQRAADHGGYEPYAEREPERGHLELRQRDASAVGAEAVIGRVTEREQAGVAIEKIEAQGEEPVDQHLRRQRLGRGQTP